MTIDRNDAPEGLKRKPRQAGAVASGERLTEQELLASVAKKIAYDPETGLLLWLPRPSDEKDATRWNSRHANKVAGCTTRGYVILCVKVGGRQRMIQAHRLAWFMVNGSPPRGVIDHINQIGHDNRICNLRDVSHWENQRNRPLARNNKSGINGVRWDGKKSK